MGSIFSLELFYFNFIFQAQKETESPWLYFTLFFIIIFLMICFLLIIWPFRHILVKNNRRPRSWIPPPTLMAILITILLTSSMIDARPPKKALIPAAKKFGKTVTRNTATLLITTATYFGLENLANFFADNPEFSVTILATIGCFFVALTILILKIFVKIYRHFFASAPPNHGENNELGEIQNTLVELVNRSPPPLSIALNRAPPNIQ